MLLDLALVLFACTWLVQSHQLHFIKNPESVSSPATELSASIVSVPALILKAFGLPNPDKIESVASSSDKKALRAMHSEMLTFESPLAELGHNPLDPISSQWLLIITGLRWHHLPSVGINDADFPPDFKFHSNNGREKMESVFRILLHSPYSGVDLNQLLTVNMRSPSSIYRVHLADVLLRSAMTTPNEDLIFQATSSKLFLSISSFNLPTEKIGGRYFGGTMLATLNKTLENPINLHQNVFSIPIEDLGTLLSTEAGKSFLLEFSQLYYTLKIKANSISMVMASSSLQALKRESFSAYSLAVRCLKKNIIPAIIEAASPQYGLGSILLLGDILLGMASLEYRLGPLLPDSVSAQSADGNSTHRPFCYKSKEACLSDTNGCTLNGDCKTIPIKTGQDESQSDEDLCWQCVCRDGYTGFSCQYEDISVPFWIIFTVIAIFLAALCFVIYAFMSIGSTATNGLLPGGATGVKASQTFSCHNNTYSNGTTSEECSESSLLLDTNKHD